MLHRAKEETDIKEEVLKGTTQETDKKEVFIARPLGRGEQGRQFFLINKSRSRPISKEEYWLVKEGHPDAPVRRDILKVT